MKALRPFAIALSLLTRIPVPGVGAVSADEMARAAVFYPAVGLFVGAIVAGVALAVARLPSMLSAVVLCTVSVLITGAFHEDGVADSLDGLGAGGDRDRALAIMRDSRIGTFGAVGLNLLLLARFALYQSIVPHRLPLALIAAGCYSRFGVVPLLALFRYARTDGIVSFHARVGWRQLTTAAIVPVILAVVLGWPSVGALVTTLTVSLLLGCYVRARLGGYTGDTLGLCACLCELATLCWFL